MPNFITNLSSCKKKITIDKQAPNTRNCTGMSFFIIALIVAMSQTIISLI